MRKAIDLFGADWCEPCKKVKARIEQSDPVSHGVTFTYHDASKYEVERLPLLFVGDDLLEAPSLNEVDLALERLYALATPTKPQPKPEPEPDLQPREGAGPVEALLVFAIFAALGYAATLIVK